MRLSIIALLVAEVLFVAMLIFACTQGYVMMP